MRPTKLTENVLKAFETVVSDEYNVIALTDEELLFSMNELLPEKERVSTRSFQRYKQVLLELDDTGDFDNMPSDKLDEAIADEIHDRTDNAMIYRRMLDLLKRALIKMKTRLVKLCMEAGTNWQRYKWLLQRKFNDFRDEDRAPEAEAPQQTLKQEGIQSFPFTIKAMHRDGVLSVDMEGKRWWYRPDDPYCVPKAEILKDTTPWHPTPRPLPWEK